MTPAKYPNEVEPFAIETQASVARWNKLQRVTRERDELIEALRDLVRRCDGDEGVRSDGSNIDTLAAHVVLEKVAPPAEKPEQRIYTFAVESPSEGPYTMEWQEENEAAARRQVEQRARVLAPAGTKVGRLLGTRPA
jgi:hypothetical protein